MKTIEVSVNELKFAEKNVRLHNEVQIKEFARSLEMFGQLRPVIVDSDYKIFIKRKPRAMRVVQESL